MKRKTVSATAPSTTPSISHSCESTDRSERSYPEARRVKARSDRR